MRLTDIFKFKLFDRTDKADLDVVNENFQNVETALNNCKQDLSNHKSSGDHDSRYYTETEMDGKLSGKSDTTHNHDSRYLQKSAVINSNTVTEAGYALDARQANPNVSGTLGAQINSLNRTLASHKTSGDHDNRYVIADIQHLSVNAYGINFGFMKVGRIVQLYFNGTASQDLPANQEAYITDTLWTYELSSFGGTERAVTVSDWSTNQMAIVTAGKYLRIRPIGVKISSGDLVRGSIVYISEL